MPANPSPSSSRRGQVSAARALAARQARRRRQLTIAGATIVVLAVAGGITALAVARHGTSTHSTTPPGTARNTRPPWDAPAPVDVPALVVAAGLPLLQMEATDVHFHAHLDIVINGQPGPVPANIGIGVSALSPLHTHDPTGIVHIEAPAAARFTLGELFTEWNVSLSRACVGGLCADGPHQLRFFTDGSPYTGDPTQLALTAHEEIAIIYAATGQPVTPPSSYPFPVGL